MQDQAMSNIKNTVDFMVKKPMNDFKKRIIENPDHKITMRDGRQYALKQYGTKIRSYHTGRMDKDGKP